MRKDRPGSNGTPKTVPNLLKIVLATPRLVLQVHATRRPRTEQKISLILFGTMQNL